ncbi:MAG: endonuclease/exonuclease/phosphatase family protein [Clostridiales Family XIII bacterium]|jgi:endonuclease/exonuclease/phosphatase family metal-dependent hydrolase|nr:endonuclease/exonuclease/phosphatase family protein [Clostridiales Family XIII bacterium]
MGIFRSILKALIILVIAVAVIVGGYVIYLQVNYERIEDNLDLNINYFDVPTSADDSAASSSAAHTLSKDTRYTALTFNIGFGAYDHDFSFFLDKGYMKDGTDTVGVKSRAASKDAVERNTQTVLRQALAENPDIALFQEVDVAADRSHNVDQRQMIVDAFTDETAGSTNFLSWSYATNFHTSYLCYPPTKPIGYIKDSGILTVSKYRIDSAVRRSFPVSSAFPTKFFDLDRCFSVNRMLVTDGAETPGQAANQIVGELVLINVHASAYDEGGTIRKAQMELLRTLMGKEYAAGNWVIVGGDFNHAIGGSESAFMGQMKTPPWVQPFDTAMVPEGFTMLVADNADKVATDRDSSIPYVQGVNYQVTLDGFMVSDNVEAITHNIDGDYEGSDHNPVRMEFTLR